MPRVMTEFQKDVMAQLIMGSSTSFEIADALDREDSSVKHALYALRDIHKCAHIAEYRSVKRHIQAAVWAAGAGEDATYPRVKRDKPVLERLKKEEHAEKQEAQKKRMMAQDYVKQHLQKQHTPFGWLLENAHGNDARG